MKTGSAAHVKKPSSGLVVTILVATGCALALSAIGGSLTDIGPWYRALEKPELQPPDWLFAPAWTTIYALGVAAAVISWRASRTSRERALILSLFAINGCVNVLWSALFFTAKRPDWALAEVGVLWLSVLSLVIFLGRIKPLAGALMLPYLLWVGFASYINYEVARLNGPFGA